MKAVFLDRDGTVSVGFPKYKRVDSVDKVELLPNTLAGLRILAGLDYGVFFVTNQAGIAEGLISEDDFWCIHERVMQLIAPSGIKITKTYFCPHASDAGCDCSKPKPKMILDATKEFNIDLASSYMVGDRSSDVQTGINAGVKSILVQTGGKAEEPVPAATFTAPDLLEAALYIAGR